MHKLEEAVRQIANESSDAVYDRSPCRYTLGECGTGKGCLVGQAIQRAYPEKDEFLVETDYQGDTGICSLDLDVGLEFDDQQWLSVVQSNQDRKVPWGECIIRADKERAERKAVNHV